MLSLDKNPFSWNGRGNISGLIGALSLTTQDGSGIPVENLSEDIEVSTVLEVLLKDVITCLDPAHCADCRDTRPNFQQHEVMK